MERLKKWCLLSIGTLAVGLGLLGIALPLLPTTPFLLLAAACYLRSSARFYHWLMYHPWFGSYLRNYQAGRGIPRGTKIVAISLLWLTIGSSAIFVVPAWQGKVALIGIALGVTIHLLRLKTFKPDDDFAPFTPAEENGTPS